MGRDTRLPPSLPPILSLCLDYSSTIASLCPSYLLRLITTHSIQSSTDAVANVCCNYCHKTLLIHIFKDCALGIVNSTIFDIFKVVLVGEWDRHGSLLNFKDVRCDNVIYVYGIVTLFC